jgi:hypothetical protein
VALADLRFIQHPGVMLGDDRATYFELELLDEPRGSQLRGSIDEAGDHQTARGKVFEDQSPPANLRALTSSLFVDPSSVW